MEIFKILVNIIEIIIFIYLGFAAIYIFIFAIAGRVGYKPKNLLEKRKRKFAVLIPGYKEDNVIIEVASEALKQDYPTELFDVVIIADTFKKETLDILSQLPIKLIEVSFSKSTKSKALNKAMNIIGNEYDIALILDADNIMEYQFLSKFNQAFDRGFVSVQGHRVAKNTNTNFAILDAVSEEINNHIYRLGHRALGLSSALIGSGMAFEYSFFKSTMQKIDAVGGFDKELELRLLQGNKVIDYVEDALVYDEKVQNTEVFENQRKRWLSAQFVYFNRYFLPGIKDLFLKGNIDFMDKVYQMVQPPRILLLGLTTIFAAISLLFYLLDFKLINELLIIDFSFWITIFILTFLAFIFSIPAKFYNQQTLKALISLPKGFALMFLSLFKLKGANKKFIHTQHGNANN